jgi:hypothetical protein
MRRSRPYVSLAFSLVLISCGSFTPIGEGDGEGGGAGDAESGGSANAGNGGSAAGKGGTGGNSATGGSGNASATGGSANAGSGATGGSGNATATGGSANAGTGGSSGSANAGSGGGTMCVEAKDCPAIGAPCTECPDGSLACPVTDCVNGQCSTSFPTCVEPACDEDTDCPVSLAPCTLCADGSSACPWARCDNGVCTAGIETCGGTDPCANKACGDPCQLCTGENCAADPAVLAFCNADLECQFNEPICEGKQCQVPEDCPQTDLCSLCPDGQTCAERVCVNGSCEFQCAPEACRDCAAPNVCIYQVGGPGPSHYACAEQLPCGSPLPCACIVNQGECQTEMVDGYCQCDNGLE